MSYRGLGEFHSGNGEKQAQRHRDARLTYKNPEGYADPTCFFALCNVMREEKIKKRTDRLHQNRQRDAPKYHHAAVGDPLPHKSQKKRFNTQVIHYDERGNEIKTCKNMCKGCR